MNLLLRVLVLILLLPRPSSAEGLRFYGDLLLSRGVEKFIADKGAEPVRKALEPFLARDAVHIVNLEGAAGNTSACAEGHSPCFASNPGLFDLLNGFDVVSLENNHSLDLGPQGLEKAKAALKKRNIVPLGGKGFSTVIVTNNGNIGIVAVTDVVNAPGDRRHVTMADAPEVLEEIRRLRKRATAVAVYVHWGRELFPVATERMKDLARKYVEAGADVVVGTHPHVVGTVACVEGKPVVWSLGNFLFDQKYESTKKGAVLDCDIGEDGKLRCALSSHETPFNSYLPRPTSGDPYRSENEALATCTPTMEKAWTGKFTKDGREKRLVLKKAPQESGLSHIELYDVKTGRREAKTPPMPIMRLQPVDLNGDGIREIMLIQSIYSSLDKETAKRVYVYSLDGGFHALWRGSALSRPLIDAIFVPGGKEGKPLLVALHSADSFLVRNRQRDGRIIMSYWWSGFGFRGGKELKGEKPCDGISYSKGKLRTLQQGTVTGEIPLRAIK